MRHWNKDRFQSTDGNRIVEKALMLVNSATEALSRTGKHALALHVGTPTGIARNAHLKGRISREIKRKENNLQNAQLCEQRTF